tara:strand:+ start:1398 stop:1649 length:252 start_codon:yes stop_codon:yes gene_type:complete
VAESLPADFFDAMLVVSVEDNKISAECRARLSESEEMQVVNLKEIYPPLNAAADLWQHFQEQGQRFSHLVVRVTPEGGELFLR